MTAYLYRMPVGIAGAISRPQDLTVEPVILKSANAFAAYGLAGKYDADGFFVPLADGDTSDKVKGIYVRPYPTTSQPDMVRQVGTDKNFPGDAMKRGYMTVIPSCLLICAFRQSSIHCWRAVRFPKRVTSHC